jgi:Skp family chaperone for outer membrane proteins
MTFRIDSPAALRSTALANTGVFTAAFARAPKTVSYQGRTYARDSAQSVEQRLWYLAAAARTQPSAISAIARGSYSLDEVYGLDPDRSGIDAAEAREREAQATLRKAEARAQQLKATLRQLEANQREAEQERRNCDKVNVGSVLTLGVSNLACSAKWDGQIQWWKDRIRALKTGIEDYSPDKGGGLSQAESLMAEARAELQAARRDVVAARKAYDDEARRMRQEEERARRQQARDEAAAARAEAEAAAREEAAARAASASATSYEASDPFQGQATDPGYVYEEGEEFAPGEYGDEWYAEELDTARDLFGDEETARAYAEDALGVDDTNAALAYVSPYSFDAYYSADCACDGCAAGAGDCDAVDELRGMMLDAGWGFDAVEAGEVFGADKITEAGEQGYEPPTGDASRPFDFLAVVPLIISAVMMLAPTILQAFGAPVSLEETGAKVSGGAPPPPPAPDTSKRDAGLLAVGAALAWKLLG